MIDFKCENCGAKYSVKDEYAGKTGKCKNCGSAVKIPAPPGSVRGSPPPAPSNASQTPTVQGQQQQIQVQGAPTGQTIIVQIPTQPGAASLIPQRKVSTIAVIFWGLFWPGAQYEFTRQWGKFFLFTLCFTPLMLLFVFLTCGIGIIFAIPYELILLIDGIIVAGRLRKGPIHPWRFF